MYKKGGPTCVEPGKRLSDLVDRSQANGAAARRASLGTSPLQAAPNGNSATNGRKPAPIVTTLIPTYSGRWAFCSQQASWDARQAGRLLLCLMQGSCTSLAFCTF